MASTAVAPQGSNTASGITTAPTVPAPPAQDQIVGPQSITSLSPGPSANANENDMITFSWRPDTAPGPNQVYELVFRNTSSGSQGAIDTANISTERQLTPGESLSTGDYKWGVYLAQQDPYKRLRYLGDGGNLHISGSSNNSGGNNNSGSNDPGGRP